MLTEKEKKSFARLKNDLAMPRWKYLLMYGLSFGILLGIISCVTDVLFAGVPVSEVFRKKIWVNLAMAPIAGFLFGSIMRWLSVKQYIKLAEKQSLP
jgi:hypothetical protein